MYANWLRKHPVADTVRTGNGRNDTPRENQLSVALIINDLAYIKEKIDLMCRADVDQDNRLIKVEQMIWGITIAVGILGAIFIPIAVSGIKLWLGLP